MLPYNLKTQRKSLLTAVFVRFFSFSLSLSRSCNMSLKSIYIPLGYIFLHIVYSCKYTSKHIFSCSYKVWYIVFSFPFISKYFLISLRISFLIHWLFWTILFNFHIVVNFFFCVKEIIPSMLLKSLCFTGFF